MRHINFVPMQENVEALDIESGRRHHVVLLLQNSIVWIEQVVQ